MVSTKKVTTTGAVRVSKITTDEKKQYDNEMHFVLWTNELCDTDKNQPAMRGEVTIHGVKYRLSAWVKTSKDGNPFISGEVQTMNAPTDIQSTAKTTAFLKKLPY